ncbi:hypothetical protein Y1Q_0011697 [Alligator mississippiensis]|uniref:Uncharacterized protein n=1 Tax=Alligator mississippiensis TaxID=8496 RepID=A0A151M0X9_ALLMI|nr:hypothetical protein Y1Q_0011697 [Alligator mississippiensis]
MHVVSFSLYVPLASPLYDPDHGEQGSRGAKPSYVGVDKIPSARFMVIHTSSTLYYTEGFFSLSLDTTGPRHQQISHQTLNQRHNRMEYQLHHPQLGQEESWLYQMDN